MNFPTTTCEFNIANDLQIIGINPIPPEYQAFIKSLCAAQSYDENTIIGIIYKGIKWPQILKHLQSKWNHDFTTKEVEEIKSNYHRMGFSDIFRQFIDKFMHKKLGNSVSLSSSQALEWIAVPGKVRKLKKAFETKEPDIELSDSFWHELEFLYIENPLFNDEAALQQVAEFSMRKKRPT